MDVSLGKLLNQDTKEEMAFSINPVEFRLDRSFDFDIEPCIGRPAPLVSYRAGGPAHLSFQLIFDKDADKDCDINKVFQFCRSLNRINKEKKSTPLVNFVWGSFSFTGYTSAYSFQPTRFDNQGEMMSVQVNLEMISNGEFENE